MTRGRPKWSKQITPQMQGVQTVFKPLMRPEKLA